jgi:hypothetical protein
VVHEPSVAQVNRHVGRNELDGTCCCEACELVVVRERAVLERGLGRVQQPALGSCGAHAFERVSVARTDRLVQLRQRWLVEGETRDSLCLGGSSECERAAA